MRFNPNSVALMVFFSVMCLSFAVIGWGVALIWALSVFGLYTLFAVLL